MDRIRRISEELLQKYPDKFVADFQKNKEILAELVVISSKMVRNRVAGYITKAQKGEEEEQEEATETATAQ